MTGEQIKSIFDISSSEKIVGPIQIPALQTIFMTTNQGIQFREDFITLDFENEILKIKKYQPFGMSGVLVNYKFENSKLLRSKTQIYKLHKDLPFRKPKSGDKLIVFNKKAKTKTEYNILTAGETFIELENEITNFEEINENDFSLIYVSGTYFKNCSVDIMDPTLYLIYKQYSNYKYDTYLDMGYILGFEIASAHVGNS